MKYGELVTKLEKQLQEEQEAIKLVQKQIDSWGDNGFFYRLTHRRESRKLKKTYDELISEENSIKRELDECTERLEENFDNSRKLIKEEVLEQILDYAKMNDVYLAKDFDIKPIPEIGCDVEFNPKISDYDWWITHGDIYTEGFECDSIEEIIRKIEDYGDLLPFTLEEQERILDEISSNFTIDSGKHLSLQNSDEGVNVCFSIVDQFTGVNNLLNEKISYKDVLELIHSKSGDVSNQDKSILQVENDLIKTTNENLRIVKKKLESQGLYLSDNIFIGEMSFSPKYHALTIQGQNYLEQGHILDEIPTIEQIMAFAETNNILTRIDPEEKKALLKALGEESFSVDSAPYSYNTVVTDLREKNNKPFLYIYDDAGSCLDIIEYNVRKDEWVGQNQEFSIDNPVKSIHGKYIQLDPAFIFSKKLGSMDKQELELMNLINNKINESIDNYFADWGCSRYEKRDALRRYVERLPDKTIYSEINSLYNKHVHGYIDTPEKGKVSLGEAGKLIYQSLKEKNQQFFELEDNEKVVEGDPDAIGFRWGLVYRESERPGRPTLEDFVNEAHRFQTEKVAPGQRPKTGFHVWTGTQKVGIEKITEIMNDTLKKEQVVEQAKGLPEGWHWRKFSDGSGSLLTPKDDHYFSFRQNQFYTDPESGESKYFGDFEEFQKEAEQWASETLISKPENKEIHSEVFTEQELEQEFGM